MGELVKNYLTAYNGALDEVGPGSEGWNTRYRNALEKRGLTIGEPNYVPDARYPQGWALNSPEGNDGANAWPSCSSVIYKDSQS